MTRVRYLRTVCRTCRYRGPRLRDGASLRQSCLRHRTDGEAQVLPAEWVQGLACGEEHCELYRPAQGGR